MATNNMNNIKQFRIAFFFFVFPIWDAEVISYSNLIS